MPAVLKVTERGFHRCSGRDSDPNSGDVISNFTFTLLAAVQADRDAGGPGFLARVKRFSDQFEK